MNRQRTTETIAAAAVLSLEGAGARAGGNAGGAHGDGARLLVAADGGEVVVSHGVVCVGLAQYKPHGEPLGVPLVQVVELSPRVAVEGRSPC